MPKYIAAYLVGVGDALSQLINVAVFLGENPNESLSVRAYRNRKHSMFWHLMYEAINLVFFKQDNHCFEAYQGDVVKAKALLREYECRDTII